MADLHAALAVKAVLPATHFMDQGYSDSRTLMAAHEGYAIEMLMPMRFDHAVQAQQATGYAATDFKVNWQTQQVTCPQGKTSALWLVCQDKQGRPRIEVNFMDQDCAPCPALTLCTKAKRKRRKLTLRPQVEHEVLAKQRSYQQTADFKARYALRSGVEGTISQAVGAYEMRRSRYRGFLKTHLHHVATASAINLQRLDHWWLQIPLANLFRTDALSTNDVVGRFAEIRKYSSSFFGLGGNFAIPLPDDGSFAPEFSDQLHYNNYESWGHGISYQGGHFLTAASLGYNATFAGVVSYGLLDLVVGHELTGDWTGVTGLPYGAGEQLSKVTPEARRLFLDAVSADMNGDSNLRDQLLTQLLGNTPIEQRKGNSLEDLRLSVRGWRFGQLIAMGYFQSNEEAAQWLEENLGED